MRIGRRCQRSSRTREVLISSREYRNRLVADVVTGKLDVRQMAAQLPDESLPDIGEHDADLSEDGDDAEEGAAA